VSNDLYQSFQWGHVDVVDKRRITGSGTYIASFAPEDAYFTAYFCADFNTNFSKYRTFSESGLSEGSHGVANGEQ
jgi:hypothetical protein